ncbi:putative oxidoreductase [Medicago truncatula]|uniref:3-oxo-delta(4,5)-steroid 5-beta-reductase-like protein n=1 Tax=Medicago truncatula TaxID=3880 RepID=G7JMR9_MEDTR|nr:(S)-8-oxocitronellyl enol synthase CYC2 isoform X1 [Medicago truncatula]AES91934.1 3-oxo-delta(4,5)-steroid 5-beta-reductase-like protein [Medicago truncatula]AIW09152.1 progesterone 5-beta-reductase 4 [Medicago truncatula]RHN64347.1 putative oxidoreductase [Medicago truncatula]
MAHQSPVALVVGVTGMAGLSLAKALKQPDCLGGPWKVYGAARHSPDEWFPSSILDSFITFDAVNSADTRAKLLPIANEVTHLFWVTFQLVADEEVKISVNKSMLLNVLTVLKSYPSSPLTHITVQTGTKHYLGPVHDPVQSTKLICHEPPFEENMPRLSYPNFYYALEDLVKSYAPSITYSIHRSSIIIGASPRSAYNMLMVLATYAAICRQVGLPFRFPGNRYTWEHFCDMTDARVLAKQHVWAAVTKKAKNQAFNCTNGDVFAWKSMWKVLCKTFAVKFVDLDEKEEFDLVQFMRDKGEVWDQIVEEYGLHKTKLEEIACFDALVPVFRFEFQLVSSMNKSKNYEFFEYAETFNSVKFWVMKLREMNLIPIYEH